MCRVRSGETRDEGVSPAWKSSTVTQVAIFDLDGTLAETMNVDVRCFVEAIQAHLGDVELDTEWNSYPYVTDTGVITTLYEQNVGRRPHEHEIASIRADFVTRLTAVAESRPEAFREIPGAGAAVRSLRASDRWAVALATGGFRPSALMKLDLAQVAAHDVPGAFACDDITREGILELAYRRAATHHGVDAFDRVVYLGDAPWDVRTCRALGWPFIGVGGRGDELVAGGASHVLPDLSDLDALLSALDEATVPAA